MINICSIFQKYVVFGVLVLLFLAGCAEPESPSDRFRREQVEQNRIEDVLRAERSTIDNSCVTAGFSKGTLAFSNCVQKEYAQLEQRKSMSMMLRGNGAANGNWGLVAANDDYTAYADKSTMRRNGNVVKVWQLIDAKNPTYGALSQVSQVEYDCKIEKSRYLVRYGYAGKMAGGEIVYKDIDITKWEPNPPYSMSEILWKHSCSSGIFSFILNWW
jgi:hypothetical protein